MSLVLPISLVCAMPFFGEREKSNSSECVVGRFLFFFFFFKALNPALFVWFLLILLGHS